MIEPLFMRFIIDRVLLNTGLSRAERVASLHMAGTVFVGVILVSNGVRVWKDYRQRLLNVRVMLSLRRSLFDRLLHLPLPKLWDMKTGGILSRLTGDVDTTTGLLQMAVISPSLSLIRLLIAVTILMVLNWRKCNRSFPCTHSQSRTHGLDISVRRSRSMVIRYS